MIEKQNITEQQDGTKRALAADDEIEQLIKQAVEEISAVVAKGQRGTEEKR